LSCTALTQVEKLLATNQTSTETIGFLSFFFSPYFWVFLKKINKVGIRKSPKL
jgi:hypothetical protein